MPESTHIEQQLTILLRRVQSIHFATHSGGVELDRVAAAGRGDQRCSHCRSTPSNWSVTTGFAR